MLDCVIKLVNHYLDTMGRFQLLYWSSVIIVATLARGGEIYNMKDSQHVVGLRDSSW